ncbi:MAG: hypothetical protein N2589_00415, partial [bacterium]|nr:hypothetical protein [bacterium]
MGSECIKKKCSIKGGETLVTEATSEEIGFVPEEVWSPSPSVEHRISPYRVPKELKIGIRGCKASGAKFSPPPFAIIVHGRDRKVFAGIRARPGWHLWNTAYFRVTRKGISIKIDLEGHSSPEKVSRYVDFYVLQGNKNESNHELLARGLRQLYPSTNHPHDKIPAWWLKPIYCGYGDQVGVSYEIEGPDGPEARALAYCTQGLYERWIRILDEEDVPIGTIIIDAGWSLGGVWRPNKIQWPDLRGFIDRQHKKGRKVLLWIATWFTEGIPDEWCIFCGKQKLVVDPENSKYISFIKDNVRKLLSDAEGCYNA